jgi:hypothetical protein
MSAAPSEPERYSIDEMMDRLKNKSDGSPEDGELITRPDGTQVVRVRKRKRRSNQPLRDEQKRTRRVRIIQISSVLMLMFVTALAIGAAMVYANSLPFREAVVQSIIKATKANVELEQFRVNPKSANAERLILDWPEGNILKSLNLRGIASQISPSSLFGKGLSGEDMIAAEGLLTLRLPNPAEPLTTVSIPENAKPILFNRFRVPALNVTLENGLPPAIRLFKSEASLDPDNVNGHPQLSLYRGELAVSGWPKLMMDRAMIEFHDGEVDIIGLRVLSENDDLGFLEFAGTITPYQPEQLSSLRVQMSAFELTGISGPAMGRLIFGKVDSVPVDDSNQFTFYPKTQAQPKLEVAFHVSPTSSIEVNAFPFLFGLSRALDDVWYERPTFESDATGTFLRETGTLSLRNLNLESKGRMAIRGDLTLAANQNVSGELEVGIAEAMIASSKDVRLDAMFSEPRDGFRWITLKISGPVTKPVDNFKELYSDARPDGDISPGHLDEKTPSFEELTRPR